MTGVAGYTHAHNQGAAMIDDGVSETLSIMANTAIFSRVLMHSRKRQRHRECVNRIRIYVA